MNRLMLVIVALLVMGFILQEWVMVSVACGLVVVGWIAGAFVVEYGEL